MKICFSCQILPPPSCAPSLILSVHTAHLTRPWLLHMFLAKAIPGRSTPRAMILRHPVWNLAVSVCGGGLHRDLGPPLLRWLRREAIRVTPSANWQNKAVPLWLLTTDCWLLTTCLPQPQWTTGYQRRPPTLPLAKCGPHVSQTCKKRQNAWLHNIFLNRCLICLII